MRVDELTNRIIGAAIEVHRHLGPGLLESMYESCLVMELEMRRLSVERQRKIPIRYKSRALSRSYRLDLVVEDTVLVEIKSVARLEPVHTAQVLTYLRISGYQVGLLVNFNVPLLTDGLRRLVLNLPESPRRSQRLGGK